MDFAICEMKLDLGCGLGKRQRRRDFAQRIMREYLVEMAERSNPHAFIEEPVGAVAERVTLCLAQQLLIWGGEGRECQRGKEACKENSNRPHRLAPGSWNAQ